MYAYRSPLAGEGLIPIGHLPTQAGRIGRPIEMALAAIIP